MAPKAISLAYAGRKLTGPPEGYGKRKETQVKRWITDMARTEDLESAEVASVATLTEIDGSKEDLYRSLRDSTDGYGTVPVVRPGGRPYPGPGPPSQQQQHRPGATTSRPGTSGALDVGRPPSPLPPPGPSAATTPAPARTTGPQPGPLEGSSGLGQGPGPPPSPGTHSSQGPRTSTAAPVTAAGAGLGSGSGTPSAGTSLSRGAAPAPSGAGRPRPGLASGQGAGGGGGSFGQGAVDAGGQLGQTLGVLSSITSRTALNGAGSGVGGATPPGLGDDVNLLATGGGAGLSRIGAVGVGGDGLDSGLELAAEMVLARVEAALPAGTSGEEKYRLAVLLALEERQRLQDQIREELAAVRAIASEARAEAAARAADVQVAVKRAAAAEEELGRVRADALAHKQAARALQVELEESREARDEQLATSQAELAATLAQLKEQSARAARVAEASTAEAASVRSELASLQREVVLMRRHHEQERLRMEAVAASLQASLDAERATAAAMRAERDRTAAGLQAEAAARKAAEESERKALRAATKQAETQEALQDTAAAIQAARQRMAAAAQRTAAVRAVDPAAAVLDQGGAASTSEPPADRATGVAAQRRQASGSPGAGPAAAARPSPTNIVGRDVSQGPARPGGSPGSPPAAPMDLQAAVRADSHRALSRGLAAERQQLGDAVAAHRRAAAAAELADARVAEAALSAAPEYLRALGLAFRAYLVGGGGPGSLAGTTGAGAGAGAGVGRTPKGRSGGGGGATAPPPAAAAALAARLSTAGYRVYVDPLTVQPGPDPPYEVPSAPLVGLSAAVVVLAAPGLLRRPLARGELCSAARHGCPLVVISPGGQELEALMEGEELPLLPPPGVPPEGAAAAAQQQLDLALEALREAWPSRLELQPDSPAAATAVAARLGLTDPQLALLPPEALRPLAISRTRAMPDLAYLNAPQPPLYGGGGGGAIAGLQHLKLSFEGAAAGRGGGSGGGGGGGGVPTGALVELLMSVLQGNTSLTALTLRGCPASAARKVAEAALRPQCRVSTIAISTPIPLAQLAGRTAAPANLPPPAIIDLGGAGAGAAEGPMDEQPFTDEDAEVVAAALRARAVAAADAAAAAAAAGPAAAAAPPPPLISLSFPSSSVRCRLSGVGVEVLVGSLTALQGLRIVNGVDLQAVAAAARPRQPSSGSNAAAAAGGARGGGGGGLVVLDLAGSRCGPVVLALLLVMIQPSFAALPALNLTGCEVGPVGASRLADATAAAVTASSSSSSAAASRSAPGLTAGGSGGSDVGGVCKTCGLLALQTACMADNNLGPEGVERLLSAMVRLRAAQQGGPSAAGAGTSQGGGRGGGVAATTTTTCGCGIRILDLSLNGLGDAGCKSLARWLPALSPSLRVLALSHNAIGTEGARALAAVLPSCTGLKELLLAGNQMGDQAVRELASAMQGLTGLQVLHLEDNHRLGADGVGALAACLAASLPSLEQLDLSRSHAGNEGARHLGKALQSHPALTSLNLESCKIRAEGAAHLAAALAASPSPSPTTAPGGGGGGGGQGGARPLLAHLGLGRNQLGDRGVGALAESLGRNRALTSLDLRSNGVGLTGCRVLRGVLRERNATLRVLALAGNEMEDAALQALEDLAASQRHVARVPRPQSATAGTPATAAAPSPAPHQGSLEAAPSRVAVASASAQRSPARQAPGPANAAAGAVGPQAVPYGSVERDVRLRAAAALAAAAVAAPLTPGNSSNRRTPPQAATPGPASGRGGGGGGGGVSGEAAVSAAANAPTTAAGAVDNRPSALIASYDSLYGRYGGGGGGSSGGVVTEALLSGVVGFGAQEDGGGDALGLGALAGGKEEVEDLEELLRRYRTTPTGTSTTGVSPSAAAMGSGAAGGLGGFLDLGYTGL